MAMIRCPTCGAQLELDDQYLGQEVDCGECRATFVASTDGDRPPTRLDDEDFDRPRRSRSSRRDIEWARAKLRSPGTWLQIVGWWGIFGGALNLGLAVLLPIIAMNIPPPPGGPAGRPPAPFGPREEVIVNTVSSLVGGVFVIAISVLIIIGATRMKRLESYNLALTAAILAMVPCSSPCCLIGLPFGIIALQTMNDPEVRDLFDDRRYSD